MKKLYARPGRERNLVLAARGVPLRGGRRRTGGRAPAAAVARALGFELAGRIQAEIEALDWVTGPQRVTSMEPGDAEVHGWAGGVLVRFVITGGRLCAWSQRACGPAQAASRLAATPPGWAGFARRNAELAAALAAAALAARTGAGAEPEA